MVLPTSHNRFAPALLLTLACVLPAVPAWAQEAAVIKLARIAGTVESLHADETGGQWLPAYPGDELSTGWSLRTGAGAKAQLIFPQDNVVILRENSYLVIDAVDSQGGAQLKANSGGLLVNLRNKLAAGSEFEVDTGAALAVVRGTKFGATVLSAQGAHRPRRGRRLRRQARFYGYEGEVEVRNQHGARQLGAGFDLDASNEAAPREPVRSKDEARQFRNLLEREDEFKDYEHKHPDLSRAIKERNDRRQHARDRQPPQSGRDQRRRRQAGHHKPVQSGVGKKGQRRRSHGKTP